MPNLVRKVLRRLGKDLTPYPPPSAATRNVVAVLDGLGVDLLFDAGANVGQYASDIRRHGYRGGIVSFEPVAAAHRELERAAAADPDWTVAPRTALGAEIKTVTINVSNRSDMSSLLPIREETLAALPKSHNVAREEVPLTRLDAVFADHAGDGDKCFLKIDTQGYERQVLDGAEGVLDRLSGMQLELSLRPLYDGEATYLELIAYLAERGFEPVLVLPGYFSKNLARQLQIDVIFARGA